MYLLDRNIRENAKNIYCPNIKSTAIVKMCYKKTHKEESEWIVNKIAELRNRDVDCSIAILVKQRSEDVNIIISELEKSGTDYFYGLFSDESEIYIGYHRKTMEVFFSALNESKSGQINKTFLDRVYSQVVKTYQCSSDKTIESLLMLTKVFFERITKEYSFLNNEEKISYICDTLENRALKHNMDLVNSKLFISTVHGAKGLEWDYVFIPDMEPYCFPNYPGLCCSCCAFLRKREGEDECIIAVNSDIEKKFIEELSAFYVAITRAKKDLFLSASKTRYNAKREEKKSKISCLAYLPGIKLELSN